MPDFKFTVMSTCRINARDAKVARRAFGTLVRDGRMTPKSTVAAEPWGTFYFSPVGKPRVLRIQRNRPKKARKRKTVIKKADA